MHRGINIDADSLILRAQLRYTRRASIRELRLAFEREGLDVSNRTDGEVGQAVLHAATPHTQSSRQLFGRAYAWLMKADQHRRV